MCVHVLAECPELFKGCYYFIISSLEKNRIPAANRVQLRSHHRGRQLGASLKRGGTVSSFLSAASHKHAYANLQCNAADGAVLLQETVLVKPVKRKEKKEKRGSLLFAE